ncbi:hypothetical protein [Rhizobium leucaenae]|uniref:hypothetical protein n=1 Tax=Rhizobium leucaenae TaxID=29450 RepID=UPI001620DF12|nr:hypothetical protein [Rhizobium leucaenae]MBB6299419.1 hypothetical protein [Rhizobium leucaenae]
MSETADIAEVTEDTFRTWLARNVSEYVGRKDGHRLWFSAHEAYYFALVRDLTAYGVSVRIAMFNASRLADEAIDFSPIRDEVLVVRRDGEKTEFRLLSRCEMAEVDRASLFMPLAKIWQRVIDRAAIHYACEAA